MRDTIASPKSGSVWSLTFCDGGFKGSEWAGLGPPQPRICGLRRKTMGDMTLDKDGALTKMRGLLFGFSVTRSIAIAAELGIADRLTDRTRTAADLARECGVL